MPATRPSSASDTARSRFASRWETNLIQRFRTQRARLAAFAGAIAGGLGIGRGPEELNIFAQRATALACGPAENSGGDDRVEELRTCVTVAELLPGLFGIERGGRGLYRGELKIRLHVSTVSDLRFLYTPILASNSEFHPNPYSLSCSTASARSRSSSVSTPIVSAGAAAT